MTFSHAVSLNKVSQRPELYYSVRNQHVTRFHASLMASSDATTMYKQQVFGGLTNVSILTRNIGCTPQWLSALYWHKLPVPGEGGMNVNYKKQLSVRVAAAPRLVVTETYHSVLQWKQDYQGVRYDQDPWQFVILMQEEGRRPSIQAGISNFPNSISALFLLLCLSWVSELSGFTSCLKLLLKWLMQILSILVMECILIHTDIQSHLLLVSSLLMDEIKGRD